MFHNVDRDVHTSPAAKIKPSGCVSLKISVNLAPLAVVLPHQFIEMPFPRSSSGFCERFAGQGGSGPGQAEDSPSERLVDPASCYLDLNSDGDLVTRALAELDLSSSVELISSGGRHNADDQRSITSCDTEELLRTPSPCVIESEQEPAESANTRDGANEEGEERGPWTAISSIHNEKNQGFGRQTNDEMEPITDVPTTSTPKKQKVNECTLSSEGVQILEGHYEGTGYHRDGSRVGRYSC